MTLPNPLFKDTNKKKIHIKVDKGEKVKGRVGLLNLGNTCFMNAGSF
jgi:ubiquitin C-terminal hydrolase